ncbi:MAG: LuxR C-terminal-related transcriptional regulator [Cyanobacteria bacterium P01_H01_bin.105]
MLDDTKLVWSLQRANQITQGFSTSLNLDGIAHLATDGLVKQFDCAFARIWLVEPDRKLLRLVASSGLYTHTDGSFSRVPMGEFKIGRIAKNHISLLSNNLAAESWVRHPEWAISNKITSFVGYPLANSEQVIGVLAAFGHHPMRPEFLEVLLGFCTTLTVALEMASLHQKEQQGSSMVRAIPPLVQLPFSESLAHILGETKLTVLGTERSLDLSQAQLFLKVAEILKTLDCNYCRLTYAVDSVSLEAMAATQSSSPQEQQAWESVAFGDLSSIAGCFGGSLNINTEASIKAMQISLTFPSLERLSEVSLRVQCRLPLLQTGFTQLAYAAGLRVQGSGERHIPLLTDQPALVETCDRTIWLNHNSHITPNGVKAQVNLSTTATQLRAAVTAVMRGEEWGLNTQPRQKLSRREQEVISLLVKGLRDREISETLYISDSTVKFHINNILAKLKAKTRLQALYQLMSTNSLNC